MAWLLAGVVAVLGIVLWLVIRPRGEPAGRFATPGRSRDAKTSWTGHSWGKTLFVPHPEAACPRARELMGRSFPAGTAPNLPLPGCNAAQCHCSYLPARERRSGGERHSGQDRRGQIRFGPGDVERRSGKDRRRKRSAWDHTTSH
jgi:hypothetical protein